MRAQKYIHASISAGVVVTTIKETNDVMEEISGNRGLFRAGALLVGSPSLIAKE